MTDQLDFSGTWRCAYWYPSNNGGGSDSSVYLMKAYQTGDKVVMESLPTEAGDYMLVRLTIEDDIAVGSWHETTAPEGEFKGAMYSGNGQLIINFADSSMKGKWSGAGYDHGTKKMKIYNGLWTIGKESD